MKLPTRQVSQSATSSHSSSSSSAHWSRSNEFSSSLPKSAWIGSSVLLSCARRFRAFCSWLPNRACRGFRCTFAAGSVAIFQQLHRQFLHLLQATELATDYHPGPKETRASVLALRELQDGMGQLLERCETHVRSNDFDFRANIAYPLSSVLRKRSTQNVQRSSSIRSTAARLRRSSNVLLTQSIRCVFCPPLSCLINQSSFVFPKINT